MSKIIIACDSGKNTLKALAKEVGGMEVKKISFSSKYHITDDINEEIEGNSYMISLEGKNFVIGDSGKVYDFDSNKEKEIHKLGVYTAITQVLKPDTKENEIYMVLACPLDFISNKELKDGYKNFISNNNEEVNITVDGEKYSFVIKEIMIKQEGSGAIYNNLDKYEGKEVAVIDLGGVNFGFCIYNNCIIDKSTRFARDFGGNYLNNLTINILRGHTKGKSISPQLALKSLKDGVLTLAGEKDGKSIEIIESIKEQYLNTILDEIKKAGQSVDVATPVFCGGTTELIKETIKKKISHAEIVENPQFESTEGLFVIANNKYNIDNIGDSKDE